MGMSLLEQILTTLVWAAFVSVFLYFRSLAIKQQQRRENTDKTKE
jgi:uncharacterized membrane protein